MKKTLMVMCTVITALVASAVYAQRYDLRQYPSAGRGVVIMGAELPPNWYLDIWINPLLAGGLPQGPPSFTFIPHPTGQERRQEVEIGNGVGAVTAYVIAWEPDRVGGRVVRATKYPIVRFIGQVPDWNGYYWGMYIGLAELGVRSYGTFY